MQLTAQQFNDKLNKNELIISLIGMSNIGKTFWANSLQSINFRYICCDDLIEEKLEPELTKLGYKGLADVAKWMGHPYQNRFPQNQKQYLELENQTMREILSENHQQNTAIDTTGSVIYTDSCPELKEKTFIVYIRAPESHTDRMFQNFLKHPKPIIWGESFQQKQEQDEHNALAMSYPKLLKYRAEQYEKHADHIISYEDLNYKMTPEEFLNQIHATL